MKKHILLLFVAGLFTFYASAQLPFSFGGHAGYTLSMPDIPNEKDAEGLHTFHVGAFAEFKLVSSLSLQTGLNFGGRGTSIHHDDHHDDFTVYALELPINLMFRKNNFFIGLGPSFGYALSGKFHSHENGQEKEEDIKFGTKDGETNPLVIGAQVVGGYELNNGLFTSIGYNYQLNNHSNIANVTTRFDLLRFSIGYRFNRDN
ncbi:MAG: PorT family protein [Bacteroidia bacterium]|jgi:hypothetical protein|nr:PorT family protein [Bacteroidia bacterium]